MQKLQLILSSLLMVSWLTGCTTGDTSTSDGGYNNQGYDNTQNQQSVVPQPGTGHGLEYDLSGYLLPTKTLESRSVSKTFHVTYQDSNGYFTQQPDEIHRYLEGVKDDLDRPIVNVFEGIAPDQKRVERYVVDENRISVTYYDANDVPVQMEQYRRYLQAGSDLLRNENGACVIKEHLENFDMSDGYMPVQADPNGYYGSVLHVYCGDLNGTKIDRYYAEGWGQIAAIRQNSDGSTIYSVFDQNSYEEH
ncbi:MAG TPA: hypothetical protein ENK93_02835 [Campylobacteraceae bacterium]|jgi:hypothetical protein|nr:hypothetical protein [Campylobacteraceae bacterium]